MTYIHMRLCNWQLHWDWIQERSVKLFSYLDIHTHFYSHRSLNHTSTVDLWSEKWRKGEGCVCVCVCVCEQCYFPARVASMTATNDSF